MDEAKTGHKPAYCSLECNVIQRYIIRLPERTCLYRSCLWRTIIRKNCDYSNRVSDYTCFLFLFCLLFCSATSICNPEVLQSHPLIFAHCRRSGYIKIFIRIFFLSAGIGVWQLPRASLAGFRFHWERILVLFPEILYIWADVLFRWKLV